MPGSPAADGTPPYGPMHADVIQLGERRRAGREERDRVGAASDSEPSPEDVLAETVQALFVHRGRTLTDPATAEAFDITLEAALLIFDATVAQRKSPEESHRLLRSTLQAARRVPEHL